METLCLSIDTYQKTQHVAGENSGKGPNSVGGPQGHTELAEEHGCIAGTLMGREKRQQWREWNSNYLGNS